MGEGVKIAKMRDVIITKHLIYGIEIMK